ncbi:SDR family oxidoreductase [Sediminibacillus massiliensis]|uniref:SDR family oxidoreductase n=1 Tax=Sediminibacillus massiliensis TaxID=1926277 RepID=UPI00098890AF|nr:SDR family NAD(P)-dependent oxidoreductase [Sediminibacillus massiliensis]
MESDHNIVIITGGSAGIGLALAERFLNNDNEVIIVGRRKEKLEEAKSKFPRLHTRVCDVSQEKERLDLFEWVKTNFPKLNMLINNAGIQQRSNLMQEGDNWKKFDKEISINVDGPIHLSMLFAPFLANQPNPAIINVSSGLALTPGAWVPVYSATKAALHSFTVSLRLQLAETGIHVAEILPPAVNTDLGGTGLHTFGAPLQDFADSVFARLLKGDVEIGYGDSEARLHASMDEIRTRTEKAWSNFQTNNPDFLD